MMSRIENENSVAFIAKIKEIHEILGADNIESVTLNGWNCITKKGEYNVDDLVIIATTDAVIPQELSDLMGVTSYLRKGQRVRTVKLKGVYSECLIIPLSFIPYEGVNDEYFEGKDMMSAIGIFKYEPPARQVQLASGIKIRYKDNPNFHIYYKFPNIKNVAGMFKEEDIVQITRKIHGTNARYGIVRKSRLTFWDRVKKFLRLTDKWIDYEYVYGSHNVEKGSDSQGYYSSDVWKSISENYQIKDKLWEYVKSIEIKPEIGDGITIYGEIYGAGIQKGYDYGLKDIEFVGFDVKEKGEYLSTIDSKLMIKHILKLPYVEILYFGKWSQDVQDSFVFNNFIQGTKMPHEGIVIKYHTGERQKIAKVINPEYLIASEKHDFGDSH